jgi:serine/threonine-protein kinase
MSIAKRYELRRPLGHGGMAVVDLAHDRELDRPVALKRLAENLARDTEIRARFLREAQLAARLSHPHVVRVYDVGEDEGRPFIAMEYVDGESLAAVVARRGGLPPEEAAQLAIQACSALAAAHAAGLVHRDVKPQNLLLCRDGTLKLTDFGIAVGLEGTRLTTDGTVLGTAAYLAPEQARGDQVTAAADLYGLGAVLFELLTGRPPRTGFGDDAAIPDVRTLRPDVPAELAAIVASCLAADPGLRPGSAAELAHSLAAAFPGIETQPLPQAPPERATQILAAPDRSRRRLLLGAAAAACAVVGLVLALVLSGSSPPRTPGAGRVQPVRPAAQPAQQAKNLASWLRANSG